MGQLVEPGVPGRLVLVQQRRVERSPYTNCGPVDNTRQAIRAGLAFPNRKSWISTFRRATGIPEVNGDGSTNGTRASDRMKAWGQLCPWYPIVYGGWNTNELYELLLAGEIDASCTVQYGRLPAHQRRWSPSFTRGHQIGLVKARIKNGNRQALIVDPLGTGDYGGDWMSYERFLDACPTAFAGNLFYAQTIVPGGGMSIAIEPSKVHPAGTRAKIPKGTRTWSFSAARHNLVPEKDTAAPVSPAIDATVRVINQPKGRTPNGAFVHIVGGRLAGRYARSTDVTVVEAPGQPTDCQAQIDAAVLPLKQTIKAQDAAIDAAQAALDAVGG